MVPITNYPRFCATQSSAVVGTDAQSGTHVVWSQNNLFLGFFLYLVLELDPKYWTDGSWHTRLWSCTKSWQPIASFFCAALSSFIVGTNRRGVSGPHGVWSLSSNRLSQNNMAFGAFLATEGSYCLLQKSIVSSLTGGSGHGFWRYLWFLCFATKYQSWNVDLH